MILRSSVVLLGWTSLCLAGTIGYNISLDTSPLIGHAAAPFSLNFQFNDGQGTGDANNTVSLNNFTFGTSGSAVGVPSLTNGASGSLGSGILLADSSFFNSFVQGFTPGSALSFLLQFTNNVDPGGTPDEFSFAILDSSGFEIPTLNFANALMIIDIDSASPVVQTFGTDPSATPFGGGGPIDMGPPTIPEPNSGILLSSALALLALVCRCGRPARSFPWEKELFGNNADASAKKLAWPLERLGHFHIGGRHRRGS